MSVEGSCFFPRLDLDRSAMAPGKMTLSLSRGCRGRIDQKTFLGVVCQQNHNWQPVAALERNLASVGGGLRLSALGSRDADQPCDDASGQTQTTSHHSSIVTIPCGLVTIRLEELAPRHNRQSRLDPGTGANPSLLPSPVLEFRMPAGARPLFLDFAAIAALREPRAPDSPATFFINFHDLVEQGTRPGLLVEPPATPLETAAVEKPSPRHMTPASFRRGRGRRCSPWNS